jgi:flagellar hook-associated protein 1
MANSTLMSIGATAMRASYAQLQSTGHNIANANTKGYSRQQAELASAGGQSNSSGFFGQGVNVVTVSRAHDAFLTREAALSRSLAAADSARSGQLNQLEKVFGVGEAGIGYAAGQFFNAYADVSTRPQDVSARQVVLAQANTLASRFAQAGAQLDELQSGVTQDLQTSVAQVNSLTQQIAALNQRIADVRGTGQPPNDLLDQRELAVNELSAHLQVTTIGAEDGTLSVFMGGGQALVLGTTTTALTTMRDPYDPARVAVGTTGPAGQVALSPATLLAGGSIAGLVQFQRGDLTDARNQLGQLALSIGLQVNQQQAAGIDLLGQAGAAMFRFGDASGAPVTAAQPRASNTGSGSISLTLLPPAALNAAQVSGVQARDYEVHADGAGGYLLMRLRAGAVDTSVAPVAVSNGSVVDGFQINIGGAAAANDRFVLQPAALGLNRMAVDLANPQLIAAGSPLSAVAATGNRGTGAVASLSAASAASAAHPNLPATLRFQVTATPGLYTYTWQDSTGTSTPLAWQPGQPVAYAGTTASNGFTLQIAGVPVAANPAGTPPVAGDSYTVSKNLAPLADNTNANAMLALRDAALVGTVWNGGTKQPGTNATDAYANLLASVGVRVQTAQAASDLSTSVAKDAEQNRTSRAGVNLDEEAARLIQFQQSYQAAAKMLQVAQSVFDTLLSVAAR